MELYITGHARERLKKRTDYSPQRFEQIITKAYYEGKIINDFPKQIKKYLSNVLAGSNGDFLTVLGNDIYIWGHNCLITVFPFPNKLIRHCGKNNG